MHFGHFLAESGRLAEAEKLLRENLELSETHSRNVLAWMLAAHPDARIRDAGAGLAFKLAKAAADLAPTDGMIANTLGVALYRAERWTDAIAALDKSMELRKGGDSFDWFFLAMAHWQLGQKDKARQWYDRAVQWMDRNQPKNEELRRFHAEATQLLELNEKK
jgi:Tfp pilus assembly protein PilF